MEHKVRHVVVVGGGSAGWLTAGIIAAEHKSKHDMGVRVTLIESPEVSTIGVGEGTWPSMRSTLERIGISETEFVIECNASFKQGSKFVGWRTGEETDFYYHPFTVPNGLGQANLVGAWQAGYSNLSFTDAVCEQGALCESSRAPKQFGTPEYASVVNYGYHLDAGKFGQLLQRHCTAKLGVNHILAHVCGVQSSDRGDIAAIETKEVGIVSGDLFIDCTGTASLLLGAHFKIPFLNKKQFSINDCAIAIQVPYESENSVIASSTVATAQSSGWTWDIGLSSRRGVGYVYSSAHINDEKAEQELRAYISKTSGAVKADGLSARKLNIQAGHREKFWHKNCVAVGMSAGFIEPLEASALALVEMSANMIRDEMPYTREVMDQVAKRFNDRFVYRWARVIDFLKLHYVLSKRSDSDYWREAVRQENIPDHLQELLSLWRYRAPYYNDFAQIQEVFPSASYQYVLYGMGFHTQIPEYASQPDDLKSGFGNIELTQQKIKKYLGGLPSNRELIEHIKKHGLQRI